MMLLQITSLVHFLGHFCLDLGLYFSAFHVYLKDHSLGVPGGLKVRSKGRLKDHSQGATHSYYMLRFQSAISGQRTTLRGDFIVENV